MFRSLIAAVMLAWLGAIACGGEENSQEPLDVVEIRTTVSAFLEQAYNTGGDVTAAYALLDSESKASCPLSRFERMAEIGRAHQGSRVLKVEAIRDVELSDDSAILALDLSGDDFSPPFFPRTATVRREGTEWRYVLTTDPSCQDVFGFFDLPRGVEATPPVYADPACDDSYPLFCIPPPPPNLDCSDIEEEKPFAASPPDPHGFDTDGDGFGCEANQPGEP